MRQKFGKKIDVTGKKSVADIVQVGDLVDLYLKEHCYKVGNISIMTLSKYIKMSLLYFDLGEEKQREVLEKGPDNFEEYDEGQKAFCKYLQSSDFYSAPDIIQGTVGNIIHSRNQDPFSLILWTELNLIKDTFREKAVIPATRGEGMCVQRGQVVDVDTIDSVIVYKNRKMQE